MASSSSSSPLAPAISSQSWKYDVFLSFRGEDTRKNFVGHLYSALEQQGIHTYIDDEKLPRGKVIDTSLMTAIEKSQIAVIVFSANYADSSWCLDEVAHIMKCKDTIVIPIFYHVDPSTVRHQKGKYGKAFANKHKFHNKNKVKTWKQALSNAGSISGWEIKNIANGHEYKAIKEIVENISSMVHRVTASEDGKLVGIATRVQSLKSALKIESGGVRMIGIWGVGGGGKTTLASSLYNEISREFDGCCSILNIREESSRHGLKSLEKEILSQMGVNTVGSRRRLEDKVLRYKRVLIVLDDVDEPEQLEKLAGKCDWFGEGSRIIITTRDEQLLIAHDVEVHNINLLDGDEAIELFRKRAFRGCIPTEEEYGQLSKAVVSSAGGLPLALEVLGSSLRDKKIDQWKSTVERLKEIPGNKILDKLKVSFDGLEKDEQDLFLDIACFYRRENKDMAMEQLKACNFHPVIGVERLRQKALITISDGYFDMHDLVQALGHYIVRGEDSRSPPEKHSRIWKKEDVERICDMDATMELDSIKAIHYYHRYDEPPPPPIVANMRNLRSFQWKGDLPLHHKFPPKELCCLVLRHVIQDQLWNDHKVLQKLKIIELYDLPNLIITPDFKKIPFLEKFKLERCNKLEEIHSSFGHLDKLVSVSILECGGIERFPSITQLKKLQILVLRDGSKVFKLTEIQQKMDSLLREKDTSSAVREYLSNLNHFRLCFFRQDLRKLDLRRSRLRDEDISSAVWYLPSLQELNLSGNLFDRLDFSLIRTPRLKWLDVSRCSRLVELSELPSSIAVVLANYCKRLKTIGDISNCKWLWKFWLHRAEKFSPLVGHVLLDSMLKGNAIEDHFISVWFSYRIPDELLRVGSLFKDTFRMRLPDGWYNDLSGFLIHFEAHHMDVQINITIQEDNLPFEFPHASRLEYGVHTYVGYVSINSLRPTTGFNSTYNVISVSSRDLSDICIGVELVPRKSKDDAEKTTKVATDSSEFWNEKDQLMPTFRIKHGSTSSIDILWRHPRIY